MNCSLSPETKRKTRQRSESSTSKNVVEHRKRGRPSLSSLPLTKEQKRERNREYVRKHRKEKHISKIRKEAVLKRWNVENMTDSGTKIKTSGTTKRVGKNKFNIKSTLPSNVENVLDVIMLFIKGLDKYNIDLINSHSNELKELVLHYLIYIQHSD